MSMSVAGGTTVVGAGETAPYGDPFKLSSPAPSSDPKGKRKAATETTAIEEGVTHNEGMAIDGLEERPFFVKINPKDGVVGALQKLDQQLLNKGEASILSKKHPVSWIGEEITPGQVGLINHGGLPKLLMRPGRYPPMPLRNWIAREYMGTKSISETVIE
ncbi:hypothetical protein FRC17_001276, partial [Serendipita sp. 399]